MTAFVKTVLDLPGIQTHEARIPLVVSQPNRWRRSWALLKDRAKKHSLGIHVYSKVLPGNAFELAARWSNGAVRKDGTGFCGRVYFDSLSISVEGDPNLLLIAEQRAGSFYDTATGGLYIARGGSHVFPPRAICERRFLVVPKAMPAAQVSALKNTVFGFKNVTFATSGTAPWGPARERMPTVDRQHFAQVYGAAAATMRSLLSSGQPGRVYGIGGSSWSLLDLRQGRVGFSMPDGDPQAGAPAGYEIDVAWSWPQVPESLEVAAMAHECSMSRNSVAAFNMDTGEPISVHEWPTPNLGQPQLLQGEPGKTGTLELVPFTVGGYPNYRYPNFNSGTCPYRSAIEAYADDDTEHVVRSLDDAAQLAYSAGDAMAIDDLRMLFEHHRHMRWSDRPDEPITGGNWLQSLTRLLVGLKASPNHGSATFLRHWGWMLTLGVLAKETAFCRKMVESYLLAVDSEGIVQREYHTPYLPQGVQGAQHFHDAIDKAAVLRAVRFLGDSALTARVIDAVRVWRERVVKNPALIQKRADTAGVWGTAKWLHRVRANGTEISPITAADASGGGFQEHELNVLGLAALCQVERGNAAEAKLWLEAGLPLEVPHSTLWQRLVWIRARKGDWSQYASYAAACEAAGVTSGTGSSGPPPPPPLGGPTDTTGWTEFTPSS